MLQDRMAIQRGPGKARMGKQTQLQTPCTATGWAVPSCVPALLRQEKLLVSRKVKLDTAAQAANQLCTAAAACAPAQDDPGFLFMQHLFICICILCSVLRPSVRKGFENTECVQRRVSKMVRHWVCLQRTGGEHRDCLENRRSRQDLALPARSQLKRWSQALYCDMRQKSKRKWSDWHEGVSD